VGAECDAAGVRNFILIGTVYPYGRARNTPVREDHPREPHTFKGRMRKALETCPVSFAADENAAQSIEGLARDGGGAVEFAEGGWNARAWHAGECLRYRAMLARIADSSKHGGGSRHGRDLVTDPDRWLLRVPDADEAEVRIEMPAGYSISAPWHPLPSDAPAQRFRMAPTPPDWLARVAIGRFTESRVELPGGHVRNR